MFQLSIINYMHENRETEIMPFLNSFVKTQDHKYDFNMIFT